MLIVVEGCVGAGKTTLAKGLALCRGSNVLLEDFESNPFLREFYANPVETALEAEFAFLLVHFHQLKSRGEFVRSAELITDFHLEKDLLYADLNLGDGRVRRVFGELYDICLELAPHPDLTIFLSASTELLLGRIQLRNRDFEQTMDARYYDRVNEAYEAAYEGHTGRKLRVMMDDWDFVKDPNLYKRLSSLVDEVLNRE